jgi:Tat protein translocase TatB subunit
MFNIGFTELVILGVIALLVIGPEQLPDMARRLGKILNELKRAKDEIMDPVEEMKAEARGTIDRLRREANEQINNQVSQITNVIQSNPDAPSVASAPENPEEKKNG